MKSVQQELRIIKQAPFCMVVGASSITALLHTSNGQKRNNGDMVEKLNAAG